MKRKLRKLRKNPSAFARDMVKKRVQQARRLLGAKRSDRRYSVIAAVYGAESYLDDFFHSLVRQTIGFEQHLELIMVDDGSPDGSAEVIARWQSQYPHHIRYIRKENGGQASARNVGLEHATGEWVTFIDPDDFVDVTYFERVDEFLDRPDAADVSLVSCNFIVYEEKTRERKDIHPLRFRFTKGDRIVQLAETNDIQLTVNSALFRHEVLRRTNLRFDERIRPSFEDAHFSNRYLLETVGAPVAFLASAKYYYRKRADQSSTLDGAWNRPGLYREVLEHGCLDLLRRGEALSAPDPIPVWLQRAVLYHLIWYFKRLVDHEERVAFLSDEQRRHLATLLRELIRRIDTDTIIGFELGGAWLFHKVGLLGLRGEKAPFQHVYVQGYDPVKKLVQLRYFHCGPEELESFSLDDDEIYPTFAKRRRHDLLGERFLFERIVWVPLEESAGRLHAQIGDGVTRLVHRRKIYRDGIPIPELVRRGRTAAPRGAAARMEHRLATSRPVAAFYADAVLFMDRDTQADDNAEHLYRYVRRERPDINAFFVLRRSSHDWDRLAQEGFRLLAYGSPGHRMALLNAKHVISSHADQYVLAHPGGKELTALLSARFTFLQHGVTKDDISGWLNGKEIDCFVTASAAEHASIVGDGPYKYTDREVVLSGFPRHDALADAGPTPERLLVIMPTWRDSLVGAKKDGGNERELNPAFYTSEYAQTWKSLLHSPELRSLAKQYGYRVQFFPHVNIQPYLDWFAPPAWIETLSHRVGSIQDVFRAASLMLTDYSSTAFEMAYLRKAVIYYQFDRDEVFGGAHFYRKGYFDYERDGFGPVCTDEDALLRAVRALLAAGGVPSDEHLARMQRTFAFRDGRCCERTLEAILALDEPEHPRARAVELLVAAARSATAHRAWLHAERRWERALELDAPQRPDDVELRLAEAKRELGKLDEAGDLLDIAAARTGEHEAIRTARAELATSAEHWTRAAELWTEIARGRAGSASAAAWLRAAEAHRNLGDFTAAAAALDAIPGGVEATATRVERAELASAAAHWDEAAVAWSALAAEPDAPAQSWLRLAEALVQTARLEAALDALDAYLASAGPIDERRARALRLSIREQRRADSDRRPQSSAADHSDVHAVSPGATRDESASQS